MRTGARRSGKNQGRGIARGFWFNIGGETAVSMSLNEDGTLSLTAGTPDIGGLRASLCMMAAEELGVDLGTIRVQIGDTGQLGYNFLTGGSRATFSSGMATVEAAREVMKEACKRAAQLWELPEDAVEYTGGAVRPAGPNAGKHTPMTLRTSPASPARPAGRSWAMRASMRTARRPPSPPTSPTWRWTPRPAR